MVQIFKSLVRQNNESIEFKGDPQEVSSRYQERVAASASKRANVPEQLTHIQADQKYSEYKYLISKE